MATAYMEPLGAAYRQMKAALFTPFDMSKWIAVGFASWISGWSSGGTYGFRALNFPGGNDASAGAHVNPAFRSFEDFWFDPGNRLLVIAIVLLVLLFATALIWLFSRGEFVFLDAVLHDRRAIAEPWLASSMQGNSLFVWRLLFALGTFGAFVIVASAVVMLLLGGTIPRSFAAVPWLRVGVGFGLVWLPFLFVAIYAELFLKHFVTPIMYRDRSTTIEAWRTFWPLLGRHLGAFLAYGLFVLALTIVLVLALIPAILLTCCVLGCLLAIPFIGAVVWLPVSYTMRGLGPRFLSQFGPEFDVGPAPAAEPAPAEPLQ